MCSNINNINGNNIINVLIMCVCVILMCNIIINVY